MPLPPGTDPPTDPGDPPVVIPGENGNPNIIISAPAADGGDPVVSYTYDVPELDEPHPADPTEADPGQEPPEDGEPDNEPPPPVHTPARFYFSRINQQKISKPVGATYTVDTPMSVYAESTTGANPGDQTIYLHCIPDVVTSGASYEPAVASAELKGFTPPSPELLIFGRALYPNLQSKKGDTSWDSRDEFLLIITTTEDSGEALNEAENHCNKQGCKYHLRVRFRQEAKPGR